MNYILRAVCITCATLVASAPVMGRDSVDLDEGFTVFSWNVSEDAFVTDRNAFRSLLQLAEPDILLLDEVKPADSAEQLSELLTDVALGDADAWHIDFGQSGGRQRVVIASRAPQRSLAEFSSIIPYPDEDQTILLDRIPSELRPLLMQSLTNGIPVNGAVILSDKRKLLVVAFDLQCCGDEPESWQEVRRRIEVREIRELVRRVLERITVDGIILSGDLNLVNGGSPLITLAGPYGMPHAGLIPAELYHLDGSTNWTWDGRGTPFSSNVLDFQLYEPHALELRRGFVLDTEDMSPAKLELYKLEPKTSSQMSDHRPLVAEYFWR